MNSKTTNIMIAVNQYIPTKPPPSKDIRFIEAKQEFDSRDIVMLLGNINYTSVYLRCGKILIISKTLKKFEEPLTNIGFLRVHKSAIINPAFMNDYSPTEVIMQNGVVVKVSRRRKLK